MDKQKVIDLIKEGRPNAKDSTIKMYTANLMKLLKMFDTDKFDFLKNIEKVEDKLKDLHYTTRRNYLNAIVVYLMTKDKESELVKKYVELRNDLNQMYETEQATGTISDKQKDSFVDISEVNKMISEMAEEIKTKEILKKENITAKEKQLLMVYILFNIYTRIPLRNDLAGMLVINKREYNKLSDKQKEENNYLVINKNKMYMVLNQYKTSAKYKELNIDIPKDLERILRQYIKINGMGILLKSSTGKSITRNDLSKLLIKTSKSRMNKSISTTMLRKIYLSSKYGDMKEELQKDNAVMGHSKEVAMNTYIKKPQEE
tara:strand:+ start:1836 stop:2786 length:951 start_codon:yes stop_codon:yes gene_type:complete